MQLFYCRYIGLVYHKRHNTIFGNIEKLEITVIRISQINEGLLK